MTSYLVFSVCLDRVALGMTLAATVASASKVFTEVIPGTWVVQLEASTPLQAYVTMFGHPRKNPDETWGHHASAVIVYADCRYGFAPKGWHARWG